MSIRVLVGDVFSLVVFHNSRTCAVFFWLKQLNLDGVKCTMAGMSRKGGALKKLPKQNMWH